MSDKYCLMECVMCGRMHAVRAGFSEGRSCVKCGGSLSYKGPLSVVAPPTSALIKDVKRILPTEIDMDTKTLDMAIAKAMTLEKLLERCKKKSTALGIGTAEVKELMEGE